MSGTDFPVPLAAQVDSTPGARPGEALAVMV